MAVELTDDMIDAALAKGHAERAKSPAASSVRYDRDDKRIIVDFENGAALAIPARALQGLEKASDDEIATVELERGYALHWEKLDVDFTIPGLMAGIFGTARFMAAKAGRSTSEAKSAAARENGKKGGRPRKDRIAANGAQYGVTPELLPQVREQVVVTLQHTKLAESRDTDSPSRRRPGRGRRMEPSAAIKETIKS